MAATTETAPQPTYTNLGGRDRKAAFTNLGKVAGLVVLFVWCTFPFVWMVSTSFRGSQAGRDTNMFAGPFSTGSYERVFDEGFMWNLGNSIFVAATTTVVAIALASLAAYAIARLPIAYKLVILSGTLIATVFPPVSLVPPLTLIFNTLGWLGTYQAMIIPYVSLTLPLSIFILTTFFASIPGEMEEAAKVDGATPWQAFRKVIVPLAAPGVFAAAILVFVYAVNEYLIALSLVSQNPARTPATVAIATLSREGFADPIGEIAAACTMVSIPLIIAALIFQRRIVAGLTSGSVKG
ncbi:carbohydrate ABC transporter permease [Egibacter rhizosphaerae]|uniref:Carbohydrate ABC transporter permease n=1 Tax=Egibacter rhizosphaerae TaxID=1670831 RepID=A0A411YIG8_9ACTN|nr:carbohydrate ABC transporter permease [Egibacter rhizosphaerae]QBI21023.1 carbohydrate ABC transporter permease [Egibacter rhizosphaerae]